MSCVQCVLRYYILVKEKNNNAITCQNNELKRIIENIESITPSSIQSTRNISNGEAHALKSLKSQKDIVIKKADKGGMFVVLDSEFYSKKMVLKDHLDTNTYEIVRNNADNKVIKQLAALTNKRTYRT